MHIRGLLKRTHGRVHGAGRCETMFVRTLGNWLSLLTTLTTNPYLTPHLGINLKWSKMKKKKPREPNWNDSSRKTDKSKPPKKILTQSTALKLRNSVPWKKARSGKRSRGLSRHACHTSQQQGTTCKLHEGSRESVGEGNLLRTRKRALHREGNTQAYKCLKKSPASLAVGDMAL